MRSWEPLHGVLLVLSGAAAAWLGKPAILTVTGALSLGWFVRAEGSFTWANLITGARLILLTVTALPFVEQPVWGLALVLALDGIDGAVARARNEATVFGARFDMETDALFVATLSVLVARDVGLWVLVAGALRPVLVIARIFFPRTAPGERRSSWGRFVFLGSSLALLAVLLPLPFPFRAAFAGLATAALCLSFFPDFGALRP